jgi:hypothetical protein
MSIRYHSLIGFDSAVSSTTRLPRTIYKGRLPTQDGLNVRLTSLRALSNVNPQNTLKRSEMLRSRVRTGTVEIWAAAAILFVGLAGLMASVFAFLQG